MLMVLKIIHDILMVENQAILLIHFLIIFKKHYGDNWLLFIDESHMTVPQLKGMYNGDFSRKKTLVEFGFRLKAAFDNRPLKFDEFYKIPTKIIYVSATPDDFEINLSKPDGIAEQLIRPTGIVDPDDYCSASKK